MIGLAAALRRAGVLGINGRNVKLIQRTNPRRLYPKVDDKLLTKRMCAAAGVPVPRLLGAIEHHFELDRLAEIAARHDSFVVKPARGAMGNGIIVVEGRDGDMLLRSGGRRVTFDDVRFHAAEILSGLYALAGHLDRVIIEERLEVHPMLASAASGGVPDVRVVVYRGVPVMSMVRLPTRASAGRANLHQGAVGAGIDLDSGRTVHAIHGGRPVELHPDTERPVVGLAIPDFATVLRIAVELGTLTGLGYVGVDVVVDPRRGPVVLEANARPGLAIQLANRAGLVPRLEAIERCVRAGMSVEERVALGMRIAREVREEALA
ncbi:MAG TPA: alpha-L-glutamate ligase-like protein [Candidatus Binatia bacterium]